jgi:membrane-associated protein
MIAPLLAGAVTHAVAAGGHLATSPLGGLLDPNTLIDRFGSYALAGIVFVIFIETGLIFPFLPGDSLLFTAGILVAAGSGSSLDMPLPVLILILFAAAFAGNQCGYLIGKLVGPRLFGRPNARILKQEYLDKTNHYFDTYGGRTIFLAQFVPIVRTFAPIAAGIGRMRYRSFWPYSLVSTLIWTSLVTTLGYFLGQISFIKNNIDAIFIVIVLVSVVPIAIEAYRHRRKAPAAASAANTANTVSTGNPVTTAVAPGPRHGRTPGVAAPNRPSAPDQEI